MANMETAEKIQRLMAVRGFASQRDLGRRLGMHPSKVNRFVNGEYELKALEWVRLARELGVSVDYLLDPARERAEDELAREDWAVVLMSRSLGHEESMARLLRPLAGTAEDVASVKVAPRRIDAKPSAVEDGGESRVADPPNPSRPKRKA